MKRNDDTTPANDYLQIEQRASDRGLEHVHPFTCDHGPVATDRIGGRQPFQDVAAIVLVQSEIERGQFAERLVREANFAVARQLADSCQYILEPSWHPRLRSPSEHIMHMGIGAPQAPIGAAPLPRGALGCFRVGKWVPRTT